MNKKIERLTINKRDEAAVVVEKIIDSEANEIILSIPRFSRLAEALANFHLIKREADLLKKKVIIESVDDKAIELAGLAKLESINPFFVRSRRQFSDIVINQPGEKTNPVLRSREAEDHPKPRRAAHHAFKMPKLPSLTKTVIYLGGGATLILSLFVFARVLPRAEVSIIRQKAGWNFNDAVLVDKEQTDFDYVRNRLPGQLFSQSQNLQLSFPASGRKQVSRYAIGKITIYNAFSSDPQPLVAKTRFVAPDGKIFRLSQNVTVPGAKVVDGKIVPSSIEAAVIADQPGAAYNIEPVSRFTIPGLKGTPKYDAFYGESTASMAGGFVGEVGYPSDDDLKKAKAELRTKLENSLTAVVLAQMPAEFRVLDGSKEIIFNNPDINVDLDQAGNFGIFGEATLHVLAFKANDLMDMFLQKIRAEFGIDFDIKSFELEYGQPRGDIKKGSASFSVKFDAVVVRQINIEELKQRLTNQSERDLKAIIFSLPGLESAKVSLWPFWVNRVPRNPAKIEIVVD